MTHLSQLIQELRCEVTRQRCRDLYPQVCELDASSRESLGAEWRCPTCAVYAAVLREQAAHKQGPK